MKKSGDKGQVSTGEVLLCHQVRDLAAQAGGAWRTCAGYWQIPKMSLLEFFLSPICPEVARCG